MPSVPSQHIKEEKRKTARRKTGWEKKKLQGQSERRKNPTADADITPSIQPPSSSIHHIELWECKRKRTNETKPTRDEAGLGDGRIRNKFTTTTFCPIRWVLLLLTVEPIAQGLAHRWQLSPGNIVRTAVLVRAYPTPSVYLPGSGQ